MTGRPELRDLLPDDVGADELARLERVHELLVSAGPPAELPPGLSKPPSTGGARALELGRRRWQTVALVAAAAAAVLFGVGFFSGWSSKDDSFKAAFGPVPMRGGGPTRDAIAQIWVGPKDKALNWPSVMKVRGLPALAKGSYYALYLTDGETGKKLLICTAFSVHAGVTTVTFNFPGPAKGKGWVIIAETPGASSTGNGDAKPLLWTARDDGSGTA